MKLSILFIASCIIINAAAQKVSDELLHTFKGHNKSVRSVTISPDGQYIASGSNDNTIKLWDLNNQALLHTFRGHSSYVLSVVFSPDGQYIASGSFDKTIKLWDLNNQEPIHTFEGHNWDVISVAFSLDSQYIASGSRDNTIKLWNLNNRQLLHTFKGHSDDVYSVAFSPDGQYIASAGDYTIKLWNLHNQQNIHTFKEHNGRVYSVAFSPDGQYIASGSRDRTIKLWNFHNRQLIHTFEGHNWAVRSIVFSPDGQYIASGSHDNTIKLWNLHNRQLIHTFKGHKHWVRSIAFSPDGQYITSGSHDKTIKLWKPWSIKKKMENTIDNKLISFKIKKEKALNAWVKQEKMTLKKWLEKGKYETTSQYEKRMLQRDTKIAQYDVDFAQKQQEIKKQIADHNAGIAEKVYNQFETNHRKSFNWNNYTDEYDTDNETFHLRVDEKVDIYLKVPLTEAKAFGENIRGNLSFYDSDFSLSDEGWRLEKATVKHKYLGKTYFYDASKRPNYIPPQDFAINLNLNTDVNIDVDLQKINIPVVSHKPKEQPIKKAIYSVDTGLPKTSMNSDNDIAVVIGNKAYQDFKAVDYALNDARIMRKYLIEVMNFDPNNILYYENAKLKDFNILFGTEKNHKGKLYAYVKRGVSKVYIFYSGHGMPGLEGDENIYFVPSDAEKQYIDNTGYAIDLFNRNLAQVPAKSITVVTDACFSGADIETDKTSGFNVRAVKVSALENGIFLASSSGTQFSTWYEDARHGMFTYFFLKGIHNKNADLNKDNQLTFKEIFNYVSDENEAVPYYSKRLYSPDFEQTPTIESKNPESLERIFIKYK